MQRSVIVGDIHGCFDELCELLDKVGLSDGDRLISVGDLVDRGPKPAEVVRLFRERADSVVVMGNHERKHVREIFSYSQEVTRLQVGDGYPEMVEWMRDLPYYFEDDHVRVVHAAMVPGTALSEQREELLCGSARGERELAALFPEGYWHDRYTDAKPIAFGHHVTGSEPMIRANRVFGLDTGACHGGFLTALCLPELTIHSVPAHTDHWALVRREWQLPVLKTRPWHDYTWRELADTVTEFGTDDPVVSEWLAEVEEWAARLRASFPDLIQAAHSTADRLDREDLRRHPAAQFLFQARNGKLDHAALTRQCTTAGRVLRLADALGIELPHAVGPAGQASGVSSSAFSRSPGVS